ncbi:MAG: hypothetical protein FWE23_06735 [Chitinivibrionia bacterium]|nr:hypothetical protein [Chitinivibrionia bacterium]
MEKQQKKPQSAIVARVSEPIGIAQVVVIINAQYQQKSEAQASLQRRSRAHKKKLFNLSSVSCVAERREASRIDSGFSCERGGAAVGGRGNERG